MYMYMHVYGMLDRKCDYLKVESSPHAQYCSHVYSCTCGALVCQHIRVDLHVHLHMSSFTITRLFFLLENTIVYTCTNFIFIV